MDNNIRHFSIGIKTVAIVLVLAIFATLIPTRIFSNVYAEESPATLLDPDYTALPKYPETPEGDPVPGEISYPDKLSEYEQLALEKLGQPATVENIDPYKRSDVSYQKPDLNSAFTRDYALRNGNHTRLVFGSPVNYKTGEGVWKKINLTLHEQEGRLSTTDAPYTLSFAASSEDANELIDLDYNGVSLSLTPVTSLAEPSEARYESATHTDDELLTENPCENGTVVYNNLFSGSDTSPSASLEYSIKPYEIKENIVVNEGGFEQYVYPFILSVNNSSALLKDNCVFIYDESGNAVYKLTAEYMKDAKDECSDQVFLTLVETENGYLITVIADAEWINDENREFPVKIDPTISISYPDDDYAYEAVYVNGSTRWNTIAVGANTVSYIKFDDCILNGIPDSAVITHAVASFSVNNSSPVTYTGTYAFRSEMISDTWSPQAVLAGGTLPSVPSAFEGLTDSCRNQYIFLPYANIYFDLDITNVMRHTFSGANNGFMFGAECLYGTMPSFAHSVLTALQITYADHSGLNSYQSTHRISIDGSGTACIKDINGDLTFIHPGISTKGEILPVSVDLVFNSSFIGTATDTYYGTGWRPSIMQTMKAETVTDINDDTYTYYVLTDGTGAKHYFVPGSGYFYFSEENPFDLYDPAARMIEFSDGSKAYFNSYGYLCEFENEYGDSYIICYSGSSSQINCVFDGSGLEIDFVYSGSRLTTVENADCPLRGISFSYTGNYLTAINTSSGESSTFAYNTNGTISRFGYRKTSAETYDRQYVQFGYTSGATNGINRVSYIIKYAADDEGVYGMSEIAYITYGDHTEYGYRYGFLSIDAIWTEYIYFDRNGRTSSVFDSYGNVSGSEYDGEDLSNMHLVTGKTSSLMVDSNLVKDFSEKTSSWVLYSVSGSGGLYSADTSGHFLSSKHGSDCFRLYSSSQSSEVYAKYPVSAAVPGKTYTLSADVDVASLNGFGGVVLGIMYNTASTSNVRLLSPCLNYDLDATAQYTFEIPDSATAGSIYILIGVKNLSGNLYFDLVSLTEGANSRPANQISDSGFYNGLSAWTVSGSFTPTVVTNERIRSISVPGNIGQTRSVSQVLSTPVYSGAYLVVSGFGKGKAVTTGRFGIVLHFGNGNVPDEEFLFSSATKDWQFFSVIIPVESYSGYVTVSLVNDYNYTDVLFGGVTVEYVNKIGDYSDRSLYYYDLLGRIEKERTFSGIWTEYSYDPYIPSLLTETVSNDRRNNETTVTYEYNSLIPTQITSVTELFVPSAAGSSDICTQTYYAYNSHGSVTEIEVDTNGNETSHRFFIYSSDGSLLEKETDDSGRYITYSYSLTTQDLLSVTDGDGTVTYYTYDSYGRLSSETVGTASFGMSYSADSISVTGDTISYCFDRNNEGKKTSFSILDSNASLLRNMASYTYGVYGLLTRLDYGNGQTKYYSYDAQGNLKFIAFSANATVDNATFAWFYDQKGNVVKYIDRSNSAGTVTKEYSYDQEGKLVYILSSDGNEVTYHYSTGTNTEYERFTTAFTGLEYRSITTVDEGNKTITGTGTFAKKVITFDNFGRITSSSYGNSSTPLTKSYTYLTKTSSVLYNDHFYSVSNETALVSSETCSISSVPTLTYTYYENGKIKTISEKGVQTHNFEYDSLGQLIREDNKKLNSGNGYTIKYYYDNRGNRTAKITFPYSPTVLTQNLESSVQHVAFAVSGYLNSYSDLLTTYYGTSTYFGYDAIYNPTKYFLRDLTWTQGNRLASAKGYGVTFPYNYVYDADGLRTQKSHISNTLNLTTIKYCWIGNRLRSEWATDGSYEIVYDFDGAGRVCGFSYYQNGSGTSHYRYVRNIQGDVTHIINSSGAVVAVYTYDTWGSVVSIKDGSGNDITNDTTSIGYINPIRYRGYYYDKETGFYYLQSRYYDPVMGRFINPDSQLNLQDGPLGTNLFCYCGNDPVNHIDPSGKAWWHWAIGAAIVVACAAATVITCGGFAAAATTVGLVASGIAGVTTASTIAAGAFIGSAAVYGMAVLSAASTSNSVEEFNEKGNSGTVVATAGGAIIGAAIFEIRKLLQKSGIVPTKVKLDRIVNNPSDDFVTVGPAEGVIENYIKSIPQDGYGKIFVSEIGEGLYQIADGHHRIAALRALGYEIINVFLTQ
ncbi:MAG: hypothetical protein IJS71_02845 [Clostridia bacterium]|nr:hypothetical protein [Clostridia bacterium]